MTAAPDIVRSAYAQLSVTDLDRARWFWVDMLGLHVQYADEQTLCLRGTDELTHHSLVLRQGPVAALDHLAYRVRTPGDVAAAAEFFAGLGALVREVPAGTGTPGVGDAVRVLDPLGFPVEFFHDIEQAERLIQRYDLHRGAHIARLDHFNICTPDIPAAYAHYRSLGFGCSETIEGDEHELYAAWMYRKQTVHDVAFTSGAGPRLHHVGMATHESHQVLRTADIFGALHRESHIERGPGRHGVSNAFYVYLRDPDGHRVEIYTSDYYTGDPDHRTYRWNVHDDRRRDFWGNAVIESWYKEASPVLDLDGNPAPVTDMLLDESAVPVGADGLGLAAFPSIAFRSFRAGVTAEDGLLGEFRGQMAKRVWLRAQAGISSRADGTCWCHDERVRVWLRTLVAWGVFALTCVLVAAGGWLSAGSAHGRAQPADAVLALAFTAAGALIVTRRCNRLGWLALLMGLSGVGYAADSYASWAAGHGAPGATWAAWLSQWVWAPAWLSLITVLLLLIPDGRLPSARWRPLAICAWSVIGLFTAVAAILPAQTAGSPANPLAWPALAGMARHGLDVVLALLLVLALCCLAALVTRLRRSTGMVRLRLVWICAGAVIGTATLFGGAVLPAGWVTPVQSAGALALPVCLGVAVLRHNLYEIDPVLRRSLTYGLLAGALGLAALGLVALGGLLVGSGRPVVTVLATILIALAVNPMYRLVSRAVNRMLYGARGDPYTALSVLGRRLAATTDPRQVLDALARAAAETVLSPYVVAEAAGGLLRVERGTPQPVAISIPLMFQGATLGWLRLAARSPGEPFDPRDRQLLDDTAAHAGAAVCAAVTELDLRSARERLVTSREEERRQLRRDLHDGVGPVLAGLGFTAEAAARALPADPVRAAQLLSSVHQQASTAITAVRQISRELRPAALAELGLADAIRQLTEPATEAGIAVTVSLPERMPEIPAATEVAAYHITAEAITNAMRHAQATRLSVELGQARDRLVLRITDDGTGIPAEHREGVGLASMRQRAEELGGAWSWHPAGGQGTSVETSLPMPEGTGCPSAC